MSIQEEQIADLVGKFKSGRISRREFVHGVSLFGGLTVTAGAIPALLAACTPAAPPAATSAPASAGATTAPAAAATAAKPAAAATTAQQAGTPKKGGTMTAATIDKPVNMDPAFAELYSSIQVYDNVFAKLLYVTADNKFVPGLAKSWKQVSDTTWQFDLVDNAYFHNGEKFTAADVKYTFARLADKQLAAANAIFFTPLEGVEVVNDTQVNITTKPNWGGLIGALAAFGEIVNEKGITQNDPKLKPIGAGPYKFTEWIKDDHITLDRSEKYYKPNQPYYDKVIFKALADDTVRLTGLQKGELNWIEQVPLQKAADLTKSTDIKANPTGAYFPDLFLINCTKPPFDKLEVRQALAWALDRQAIVNLVWYGQAKPSAECLSPDNPMYSAQNPFNGAPNPQKAKDLLASAGVELPVKAIFAAQPQVPTQVQVGQLIQQQLKPVGFDIQVQSFESAQWFEQLASKKYDFTSTYWSATLDPEHCVYPLGHSTSPWNFAGFKDDKLDAALDKFRYTVEPTARKQAYADVVTQMSTLAPMVFQVNFLRTYWTQPNVMGVVTLPSLELRMEDAWAA
jgi:peptide/nickel transport system substrate-binding protein